MVTASRMLARDLKLITKTQELIDTPDVPFGLPPLDIEGLGRDFPIPVPPSTWNRPALPERVPEGDIINLEEEPKIADEDSETDLGVDDLLPDNTASAFDVWAFYLPFHFYRSAWGIYILKSGVLKLTAGLLASRSLLPAQHWVFVLAWRVLLLHEMSHHLTELALARAQASLTMFDMRPPIYPIFFRDRVSNALEEALANAVAYRRVGPLFYGSAFRSSGTFKTVRSQLRSVMKNQGPGYSDFDRVLSDSKFSDGREALLDRAFFCNNRKNYFSLLESTKDDEGLSSTKNYWGPRNIDASDPKPSEVYPKDFWFDTKSYLAASTPTRFVDDRPGVQIAFAKPFPKYNGIQVFVYPNDHRPPHIHARDLKTHAERRFIWPNLDALDETPRIPTVSAVRSYCQVFENEISQKIDRMPWR
jgi:hypothetical protein